MKRKILNILAGVVLGFGMLAGVVATGRSAEAAELNLCDDPEMSDELKEAAGCRDTTEEKGQTIFGPVEILIQVVLGVIGVVGVGVIIYGGVTYTISTGDAAKVSKAKNIILYGIVGLVVAGLAYVIVQFILRSIPT